MWYSAGYLARGNRLIGPVVKASASGYPARAPGVIGSVLGLVSPVSVYCDWVRWKVGSATSISVWPARQIVCADPSLRYTCMLLGR